MVIDQVKLKLFHKKVVTVDDKNLKATALLLSLKDYSLSLDFLVDRRDLGLSFFTFRFNWLSL